MSHRLPVFLAASVLSLLLAACPAAPQGDGGVTTPPDRVGDASAEEAAAAYEALAEEFNERNAELNIRLNEAQTLDEAQEVMTELAELDETFSEGLDEITFPEDLQDEVAALQSANDAHRDLALELTEAESDEAYFAIMNGAGPIFDAVTEAANALRAELGLDAVPTSTPAD